jgi:hypothetical protein
MSPHTRSLCIQSLQERGKGAEGRMGPIVQIYFSYETLVAKHITGAGWRCQFRCAVNVANPAQLS